MSSLHQIKNLTHNCLKLLKKRKLQKCQQNKNQDFNDNVDDPEINECVEKKIKFKAVAFDLNDSDKYLCDLTSVDQNKSFSLPLKSSEDISERILQIGCYSINRIALKSLDSYISKSEEFFIKSVCTDFVRGWLFDVIINAFLYKILESDDQYTFADSSITQLILSDALSLGNVFPVSLKSFKYLLIPACIDSHWVLIIADLKKNTFYLYDSLINSCNPKYINLTNKWSNVINSELQINGSWDIQCPPHALQNDESSCGVFICYYAFQHVNKLALNLPLDTLQFRKFIYNILTENVPPCTQEKINLSSAEQNFSVNVRMNKDLTKSCLKIHDIEITPIYVKIYRSFYK
ncbi:uncharacterized protein LOC118198634 [Stegodyphus dumicola]|uniref:uncharacterized protein LOC118198634 n=1 Tax=Stegodyphus dumicola TaxID=202533 RepID=UPI0015B1EBCB|nr:uncharacterized protein LOC118198634 [Stegodyphus dumicola]